MTAAERGFLLLCAELGDGLKPLTLAQLRTLRARVLTRADRTADLERTVTEADLRRLGYDRITAAHICALLAREEALSVYLEIAAQHGIRPLTCISADFPARLRRLGDATPPVLFYRGSAALLHRPAAALVGSRDLAPAGEAFARKVGKLAARENLVLVSGNAHGADRTAQDACLEAGGAVIAVLPDGLQDHVPSSDRILYLCQWGWHLPMSSHRALERNRLIHTLGQKTLVAQSGLTGGTWSGSEENLRHGWSPLFVHEDGSPGCAALISRGATPVDPETLSSILALTPRACD